MLEKTRAFLVSKLGPRIEELGSDERALSELAVRLERAQADILSGLETRRREAEWYRSRGETVKLGSALSGIEADIQEGEVELRRVSRGIAEVRAALAAAVESSAKSGEKRGRRARRRGRAAAP